MSDFRVIGPDKGRELTLAGSLTIENASAIRKKLITALMREDSLRVCIEADAAVDVSFLQLLCSAHRTASKLGKSFALGQAASGGFLAAVESAGYFRKRGCARDREETCLWTGGGHD
jgi:ABC-type transporter Mla MlaB component